MSKVERPTAIDLFCGAGGLSLGLTNAGFKILWAMDNDPISVKSYNKSLGVHADCQDILELSIEEVFDKAGIQPGECHLLAGGPPCQGFSLQRRGERNDPRNQLVLQFLRMIEGIKPQYFLMENVSALLSKHGQPFLDELSQRTEEIGYSLHIKLLNAYDFGVPQKRKRAFLIGERTEGASSIFQFPDPINSRKNVLDAIGDLPSPPLDGSHHPKFPNHFRETRMSSLNLERIKHIPQGGGRDHLPEHLQLNCHKNNTKHRHKDVYGRLSWEEPAGTLTAGFDSFTRGRFAHPIEHRSLTIREGARIQTFPDSFVFEGNREDQARQVGNAVPPVLAQCLGEAILKALKIEHDSRLAA